MVFDPDQQIQQAVRLVFEILSTNRLRPWARCVPSGRKDCCFHGGSTRSTSKGDVLWGIAGTLYHVLGPMLHNPRYAGVFIYGRTRCLQDDRSAGRSKVQHLRANSGMRLEQINSSRLR